MVHVRHLDPVLETWDAVWLSRRYVKDVKDALCSFCRCPLDGCIYRQKIERALSPWLLHFQSISKGRSVYNICHSLFHFVWSHISQDWLIVLGRSFPLPSLVEKKTHYSPAIQLPHQCKAHPQNHVPIRRDVLLRMPARQLPTTPLLPPDSLPAESHQQRGTRGRYIALRP